MTAGGAIGSMLKTYVMTRFELALQSQVILAFFVPGLVYLADAIGTQTEAIAVHVLSLQCAVGAMIAGELRTGLIIGLTLGALTFPVVWLIFGDVRLALEVSLRYSRPGRLPQALAFCFRGYSSVWAKTPPSAAVRLPPFFRTFSPSLSTISRST
jgi:magnesium transporter